MSDSFKNPGTTAPALSPPRIVDRGPIQFVGIRGRYTGQTAPTGVPILWQRFAQHIGNIPNQVPHVTYGLSFMTGKEFEYLAGVEVTQASDLPEGWSRVNVPAQRYAVFTHPGHVSEIRATIEAVGNQWLPVSKHRPAKIPAGAPNFFERYGPAFDPVTMSGDTEIWFPIES